MVAEKFARMWTRLSPRKEEIQLENIYRLLGTIVQANGNTISSIMDKELLEEKRLTYLNPELTGVMETCKKSGKRTIYVSDMYLPFDHVFTLLKETGLASSTDQLYLSSFLGKRKRWGSLFKHVLSEENIPPGKLLHIGDNLYHDCKIPSELGIKTVHYRRAIPQPPWLSPVPKMNFAAGILRKAADDTFVESLRNTGDEPLSMLASYVGGPVLFFIYALGYAQS